MRTYGRSHRQTDRHDEADSRFSQFCERAVQGTPNLKKRVILFMQTAFID
jgi:hypothetical protein